MLLWRVRIDRLRGGAVSAIHDYRDARCIVLEEMPDRTGWALYPALVLQRLELLTAVLHGSLGIAQN